MLDEHTQTLALSVPGVTQAVPVIIGFTAWTVPKGGTTPVFIIGSNANTAGLHPILARIAKDPSRGVLAVTHDPRIVPFADRIVYIEDGRIVGEERRTMPRIASIHGRKILPAPAVAHLVSATPPNSVALPVK